MIIFKSVFSKQICFFYKLLAFHYKRYNTQLIYESRLISQQLLNEIIFIGQKTIYFSTYSPFSSIYLVQRLSIFYLLNNTISRGSQNMRLSQ